MMEEVKELELGENAHPVEVAATKKSKKRAAKVTADDAIEMASFVPQHESPELLCGRVVYRNDYTGVIGFEYSGTGYQIPAGDLDYHIGDPIDFMIVDGKVIIGVV